MRRSLYMLAVVTLLLAAVSLTGTACKKKVAPPPAVTKTEPPPPPPPPPSPTIRLSVSPSTVQRGQSASLEWSSTNAANVTIDAGIGSVDTSGRRSVSPENSTTYTATATGPGGNAKAEARLTVTVPPPPTPPPPVSISDSEFFSTNVKDIFFDFDQYNIREDARATLQGNARALAERPGISFTIEGHCDERGSEKYNLALGDRRANSAREFLVGQGVNASRIETISYGKEKPVCSEHTEDCWQKCRHDHFLQR